MYQYEKLIGLIIVMSLLSLLFGCKQISIKGPDFSEVIPKVIHFGENATIEYEMPGNMTKEFNYGQRYKNESERTFYVDLSDNSSYKQDAWQAAYTLDGASWDYIGGKSQGLGGRLGKITLNIFAGRYSGSVQSYITQAYDSYLNGPKGPNTRTRKFGAEQGIDIADLGHRLVKSPNSFNLHKFNNAEFISWTMENEHPGQSHTYFVYVIDEQNYLAFSFYHHFTLKSEEELNDVKPLLEGDKKEFMSRIIIRGGN